MKPLLLTAATAACLAACSNQATVDTTAKESQTGEVSQSGELSPEVLDVCEAVFRYRFEHNASGAGSISVHSTKRGLG